MARSVSMLDKCGVCLVNLPRHVTEAMTSGLLLYHPSFQENVWSAKTALYGWSQMDAVTPNLGGGSTLSWVSEI